MLGIRRADGPFVNYVSYLGGYEPAPKPIPKRQPGSARSGLPLRFRTTTGVEMKKLSIQWEDIVEVVIPESGGRNGRFRGSRGAEFIVKANHGDAYFSAS